MSNSFRGDFTMPGVTYANSSMASSVVPNYAANASAEPANASFTMPGISYPATTSSSSNYSANGGFVYDPDADVPPSHTIYIIGGAVLIAAVGAYFLLRKKKRS